MTVLDFLTARAWVTHSACGDAAAKGVAASASATSASGDGAERRGAMGVRGSREGREECWRRESQTKGVLCRYAATEATGR